MDVIIKKDSDTEVTLTVTAKSNDLADILKQVYDNLRIQVKVAGFRPGKAPDSIINKELGPQKIQGEFLDRATSQLYRTALKTKDIRALEQPKVELKKFVPFEYLEFTATQEVIPAIKLPDYKKIKKTLPKPAVKEQEMKDVLVSLQRRMAKRTAVKRPAKMGDELIISFSGKKDGKIVPNAAARDYPIILGSGRFIPGFEDKLLGIKEGESRTFTINFPKDYGEKTLAGQKVVFDVMVEKVQHLAMPKLDDDYAKKAGPFKDLKQLKDDIKRQIGSEKELSAKRNLETEVINDIVARSKLAMPVRLLGRQVKRVHDEFAHELSHRKINLQDYLVGQKLSQDQFERQVKEQAEHQVKTALVLTEIARIERINITPEELEVRIQVLRGQYRDQKVQEQLNDSNVQAEIANQLLSEKVVEKLVDYAIKSNEAK